MSESRNGESRPSYPSYTPSRSGFGESRNSGESRASSLSPKRAPKDIGDIRSRVVNELYDELYEDIKASVREQMTGEKDTIVREIVGELKKELKADIKRDMLGRKGEAR